MKTVRKNAWAKQKLSGIQKDENLPAHKLIIDQPTRWGSTYYMVQRFLEQQKAVKLLCYEMDKLSAASLTRHEWDLLENVWMSL